jgi:hypothetical protein
MIFEFKKYRIRKKTVLKLLIFYQLIDYLQKNLIVVMDYYFGFVVLVVVVDLGLLMV